MPAVPGVVDLEEIGRGGDSIVYRGRHDGQVVAVKIRRQPDTDGSARRRYRREAALLGTLRHPGLPRVLMTGEVEGRPYIVRDFIEGRTLAEILAGGRMAESRVLSVALDVVGALTAVHGRGLVHRDIKPANLVLCPDGRVRLIDFGLAVQPLSEAPAAVAGTFLYAAPEQTGLLKRPVDGRADLYALGAVLFEALTGAPPFQAADAAEVVRQHAALPAPDVRARRPEISPVMGLLVARLLEKDPDDRYPTAESLLADLLELPSLNEAVNAGRPVRLGQSHGASEVGLPLVGRAAELERVETLLTLTRRGRGAALLVVGETGTGKSAFLRALAAAHPPPDGVTLMARGLGAESGAFAPLRRAVEAYMAALPPAGSPALEHLRTAAGDRTPLLASFSVVLAERLGVTVPMFAAPELGERLYDALAEFFLAWAAEAGSLLFIVDDAHELDEATRHVLHRLAQAAPRSPLVLLLGTPRPELPALPPTMTRLSLGPLDADGARAVIGALLGTEEVDGGLVGRLLTHSRGNPFALGQFVRALLDAGLLLPHWGSWVLDVAELNRVTLPGDVMELILARLERLGPAARRVLDAASLQGRRFRPAMLGQVLEISLEATFLALAQAVDAWLIERDTDGTYGFLHERIQEALSEAVAPDTRRDWHQRMADVLARTSDPQHTEDLFALARHAAQGHRSRDPSRVFLLQLAAGERALRELAPEEAWRLLVLAGETAAADGLIAPVALHRALGVAAARTGRLDESREHLEAALSAGATPEETAAIEARLAEAALTRSDVTAARAILDRALTRLGAPTGGRSPLRVLGLMVRAFLLPRRGHAALPAAPATPAAGASDETALPPGASRAEIVAQLLNFRTYAAFFEMRPVVLAEAVLQQRWAVRRLPRGHAAAVLAECHLAILLAVRGQSSAALRRARRAVATAEHLGDAPVLARVHLHEAWVVHLAGHPVEAAERASHCLKTRGHWLDAFDFLNGCGDLAWNLYLRGYAGEALTWVERGFAFEVHGATHSSRLGNVFEALAAPILAMLGRDTDAELALERSRAALHHAPPEDRYRRAATLACEAAWHWEMADFGPTFEAVVAAFERLRLVPEETTLHVRLFYVAAAWGRLELLQDDPGEPSRRRAFERALAALERAARVPILQMHVHLLGAALSVHLGISPGGALDAAGALARHMDAPWGMFEVSRLQARRLERAGPDASLRREVRTAHLLATDHGWTERARRLQAELGFLTTGSGPLESMTAPSLLLRRQRDALLEVALASSAVLEPDQQARRVLDETLRMLGAERAFLFGPRPEGASDDAAARTLGYLSLYLRVARDAQGNELNQTDSIHTSIVDRVVLTHLPLVHGTAGDGRETGDAGGPGAPRSAMAAPLLLRDRLIGVVYVDHRRARGIFTSDDAHILLAIAQHLAVGLETARHAQLEVYRRIAANVPGMVFRLHREPEGRLHFGFVSEAASHLVQLSPEALVTDAHMLTGAFATGDAERLLTSLEHSATALTPWRWEGHTRDGERWIEGIGRPERQPDGEVIWDGLLTDVTQRKLAEEQALATNARLEQRVRARTRALQAANKELEAFNYSVSHDLRSALRTVEGFAAMLREDFSARLGPDGSEMLDRVSEGAGRMWKVLDALLDLSRLNRAEIRRERVDLAILVAQTVNELRRVEPERQVVVTIEGPLWVDADPALARVVIDNLVQNAWKYTAMRPVAHIEVLLWGDPEDGIFCVRDDGVGFDMSHVDKLFSPFQRLHLRDDFPGTGIGLFTVQRIVQRHGGRIWAEAESDVGATFFFTLRRRTNSDDTHGEPKRTGPHRRASRTSPL